MVLYPASGQDAKIHFYEASSLKWGIGNDADDSDKLKFDMGNSAVGGDTKLTLDSSGNVTSTGTMTSSQGQCTGKYQYETKFIAYYAPQATSFLPMNGYVIEKTSLTANNEFCSFVAPFNGTIEQVQWRSEVAQDGTTTFRIYESSDGTEVPGTTTGRKNETVDIADDTTQTMDLSSMTSGDANLDKGKLYGFSLTHPSNPLDTNVTMVFKWDITT